MLASPRGGRACWLSSGRRVASGSLLSDVEHPKPLRKLTAHMGEASCKAGKPAFSAGTEGQQEGRPIVRT